MKIRSCFFFAVLVSCFLLVNAIQAQEQFVHYSIEDGLSDRMIRAFKTDNAGFLWIGTHSGISRFDGKNFKNYYSDPSDSLSLSGNLINCLETDRKGNLWIGTESSGLNVLNQKTGKFKQFKYIPGNSHSIAGNHISKIVRDAAGNMWVSCFGKGLSKFNSQNGKFITYRFDERTDPYNFNEIRDFVIDADGLLWLATRVGLVKFNPVSGAHEKIIQTDIPPKNTLINGCIGPDGKLYFSTWSQGIQSYDPKLNTWKQYLIHPNFDALKNQAVDLMFIDAETILFSCISDGFGKLNTRTEEVTFLRDEFPGVLELQKGETGDGTALYKVENGIFLGSTEGVYQMHEALPGVKNYDGSTFQHTYIDPTITVVSSVISPPGDSIVYAGTYYRAGLYGFRRSGGKALKAFYYPDEKTPASVSECIEHPFKKDSWLVASTSGLLEFTPSAYGGLKPAYDGAEFKERVEAVCKDSGNKLWFVSNRTLYSYTPGSAPQKHNEIIEKATGANDFWPLMLVAGYDNRIWIRTAQRDLIGYHPDKSHCIIISERMKNSLSAGGEVEQALALSDSSLWLNVSNLGMARFNPYKKSLEFIGRNKGLSGTQIACMNQDLRGNLWMVHENGISVYLIKSGFVQNFGKRFGMVFEAPNFIGMGSDGLMYAGGNNRLIGFLPEAILMNKGGGKIYLNEIKLFNELYQANNTAHFTDTLMLNYNENYLYFNFTVPDINARSDYYYFSYLEGFDREPINCGITGEINYSGLPPGEYQLSLRAKNAAGEWCTAAKIIFIKIIPPFWKTSWFRILVTVLLLFFVFLIYRYRVRLIQKKAQEENALAEKLRELENKALRSQMNPHFIFNCLNSINSYIVKSKPEEASMYVTKFSRLIRLILDNSRSSSISLENELAALRLYIDMENLRFGNSLKYELIVEPGLDFIPVPPMIIQPFVENAIWHGLLHSNKPGFLKIELRGEGDYLICTITDNGIGREAAAELKSKSSLKKKSLGMEVTLNRLNSYNMSASGQSNLLIEDLIDENRAPAGTRVNIKIKIYHDKLRNPADD